MKIRKGLLLVSILIPLAVGAISALLTKGGMEQFNQLVQPPLSPPAWLFPVVWTILYILMGISVYLIKISDASIDEKQKAIRVYHWQLIVNFLWPTFFFNFGWYLFSLLWLLLLWILVLVMIRRFYSISKYAAWLNVPYIVWLTFAAYLNFGVWWLNR